MTGVQLYGRFCVAMRHETLTAFAAYCHRNDVTRRPTLFVQYVDIWGTPRGEIGLPDPTNITNATFALLAPWVMIPTVGEAWLVVDMVDALSVTGLKVNYRGIFNPHWRLDYSVSDTGRLSFGEPVLSPVPDEIGSGIQAAKKERMGQRYWQFGHTIDSVIPVVEELLNNGA